MVEDGPYKNPHLEIIKMLMKIKDWDLYMP